MNNRYIILFLTILLAILFTQIAFVVFVPFFIKDWLIRSQFGDMFGALNTLFSGFAFAAVFITIIIQINDQKEQRRKSIQAEEDLKNQIKVQEESAKEAEKLNKINILSIVYGQLGQLNDNLNKRLNSLNSEMSGSINKKNQDEINSIQDEIKNNHELAMKITELFKNEASKYLTAIKSQIYD